MPDNPAPKRDPRARGLGRGLSALLGEADGLTDGLVGGGIDRGEIAVQSAGRSADAPARIAVDLIAPNPGQPRRRIDPADLEDLTASVRERGILQPLILRPAPDTPGHYQIVAGERRWRAACAAGLQDVPAVVRDLDDRAVLEIAIIENVQRADLSPIEEAHGYAQLIETFAYTQEALARVLGKSRSHLANTLRLLSLPDPVRRLLESGDLTAGHARALIGAADPVALARETVEKGLTVRQVEALAKRAAPAPTAAAPPVRNRSNRNADTRMLEGDLSAAIGMKVQIRHSAREGGGEVRIRYEDLAELERLRRRLGE